jgi:amino-acid N-acetyltransferase
MREDDPRLPPQKIRVTRLQEAQLAALVAIEARCVDPFRAIGLGESAIAARNESEIARLTRKHDVLVAEADDHVAGFLVWADEAPGVAHLATLMVDPSWQRFGIGTRLLRELGESASRHGIASAVTPVWEKASWSMAFLAVRGFSPVNGSLPDTLSEWRQMRETEVLRPGQRLWWAKTDGLGTIPGLPRPR